MWFPRWIFFQFFPLRSGFFSPKSLDESHFLFDVPWIVPAFSFPLTMNVFNNLFIIFSYLCDLVCFPTFRFNLSSHVYSFFLQIFPLTPNSIDHPLAVMFYSECRINSTRVPSLEIFFIPYLLFLIFPFTNPKPTQPSWALSLLHIMPWPLWSTRVSSFNAHLRFTQYGQFV